VNYQAAKTCTSGIAMGSLVTMAVPDMQILVVWLLYNVLQLYHP